MSSHDSIARFPQSWLIGIAIRYGYTDTLNATMGKITAVEAKGSPVSCSAVRGRRDHRTPRRRLGVGEIIDRRAAVLEADIAGDHRGDIDVALGDRAQ